MNPNRLYATFPVKAEVFQRSESVSVQPRKRNGKRLWRRARKRASGVCVCLCVYVCVYVCECACRERERERESERAREREAVGRLRDTYTGLLNTSTQMM